MNPEPWAVGPVGVGRKGGKIWAYIGRNQGLHSYQQAVKEELEGSEKLDGSIHLQFFFWRQVIAAQRENYADTTNLQKALEDALQEVLYANDRTVLHTESIIMAQGPDVIGRILISAEPYIEPELPLEAVELLKIIDPVKPPQDNTHDMRATDVF
jgi:Holliday junction resolvase RusA-like endonuclease